MVGVKVVQKKKGRLRKKLSKAKRRADKNSIILDIHPLFIVLGIYYAIKGQIFVFLTITICAVIHELGHSYIAYKNGYRLNKITLMPFGAIASGNVQGLKPTEQIKIALAGPLINLAVGIFFIAVWWIEPNFYPYTELAVTTSLSLALVNMLPAYPLDGGRVLASILALHTSQTKAEKACKRIGVIFGGILILLYAITIKQVNNLSLLFFGIFVFIGAFSINKSGKYVRAYSIFSKENLSRGMSVKRIAVDSQMSVKKLISLLDANALNEVLVYQGDNYICQIGQKKLQEILCSADIYSPVVKFISD